MKRCAVCILLVAAAALAGCGSPTVPVTGTITYKSQPVADANIVFTPTSGGAGATTGKIATGRTDALGKFALTTEKPGDGALPGEYTVSITPGLPPPDEENYDYSEEPPPPFPMRYTSSTSSDLRATVKAGSNDFPFELKDEG